MGFFSFMTADTNKSITNVHSRQGALPVAVLIPAEYGGGCITEYSYDGYGEFGGCDVYELIVDWNYKYLEIPNLKEPLREEFEPGGDGQMYYEGELAQYELICSIIADYQNGMKPRRLEKEYGSDWKQELGIYLLMDENRACLKYDLKIVELTNKHLTYEEVEGISKDVDDQGYFY